MLAAPTPNTFIRSRLVELYESAGGASWNTDAKLNWLTGDPCNASWAFVTCDDDGKLASLYFYNDGLTGTLPPALGKNLSWGADSGGATALQVMYNADLSGTLPDFTLLTALTRPNFADTAISGTVPTQLGLLTKLGVVHQASLSFSDCPLSGLLPTQLGQLTGNDLTQLNFYNTALSGTIPL